MGDSFQGVKDIILQPGSATVPYTFTFAPASSATANDGSIPNSTTIQTAIINAFDEAGTDVTSHIIESESNTDTTLEIALKYPTTPGAGRYSLEMLVTLNTGGVMEFDFTRVFAKDIAA